MEVGLNCYGRTTKQQVNEQDTDTLFCRGQPRSSKWIRKKLPRLLRSNVLLLDDNMRPHLGAAMQNHIATPG
ncbi:hypothetical protein TNCV_3167451 [Trichonephila clavipes]|uniref:Transposase n=1 Tax=Trichonephila clavipes TaxID=2585209 RepID=A0A8X6V2M6_TRICX|nr:hypothetical protein TNCV_3167451 [Trichonephila clavipes]